MSTKKLYHQFACSSMMLPEHRGRLERRRREARREEEHRRPQFDEQQRDQFQYLLERSLSQGLKLQVTILTDQGCRILAGTAKQDSAAGVLRLKTADGVLKVAAAQIVALQIDENSSGDGF
jgi:hypothetical protein